MVGSAIIVINSAISRKDNPKFKLLMKWGETIALCFGFFSFGFCYNMYGPSWLDLKNTINITMNEMSYGIAARQTAYCIGALISGLLYNRLNRQLLLSLFYLGMGVMIAATPHSRSLLLYLLNQLVLGFFTAACDTGSNAWIFELWFNRPAPFVAAMHTSWAVGSIISPFLAEPYLAPEDDSPAETVANLTTVEPNTDSTVTNIPPNEKLAIPFGIGGIILGIAATIIVLLYCVKKYEPEKEETANTTQMDKEEQMKCAENEKISPDSRSSYILTLTFCLSIFAFFCTLENASFLYLPTYMVSKEEVSISTSTAAVMSSAMSSTYTGGRLVTIFLAMKLESHHILCLNIILMIGSNLILYYAGSSVTLAWIGTIILGAGCSSVYPTAYAYTEKRIEITNFIAGIVVIATAALSGYLPILVGHFIEDEPLILIYLNFGCLALLIISFLIVHIGIPRIRKPM